MSSFKKISHAALAFAYVFGAVSPALADDSEIYLGGASGTSGNPNVLLLIDTSGSMAWDMTSTKTNVSESSRRYYHLKNAVEKILSTLPGNIRVGLARYNSDSNGGRIVYPLTMLDSPAGSNADGSQDRRFQIKSGVLDDVQQGTAAGASLIATGTTLTVGGTTVAIPMAANTDASVQCSSGSTPAPFLGDGSGTPKNGLYLGNHPTLNGSTYCQSNLGLRFVNIPVPVGAKIGSAKIVLTHAGSPSAAPSGWSGTKDSDIPLNFNVAVQNNGKTTVAKTFSTSVAADQVNGRTYETSKVAASLGSEVFAEDNEVMELDVTSLVQKRVDDALTWDASTAANRALVFRVEGNSGNGAYSSTYVCTRWRWGNCQSGYYDTVDAPKIRRIYGRYDSTAKAPQLLINYIPLSGTTSTAGVRFMGVDIPKNAIINSAYLEMTAAVDSNPSAPAAAFVVATDLLDATYGNSLPFDASNHLYSSRWGAEGVTLSPGAWVKDQTYQLDVKALLQSHVNYAGYCGATEITGSNAVGFRVRALDGSGSRTFYSYEGDAGKAPRLVVNFTSPASGSCVQIRRAYVSGASSSDATQSSSTSNNSLIDEKISLSSSSRAGLRFTGITVPKAAEIVDARLTLYASGGSNGTITVRGIATDDQAAFTTTSKLSNMTLGASSVAWAPGGWTSGSTYESVNLKTVIQEIVNRAGWASGNALGLQLTGSGPQFYTADRSQTSTRPVLAIIYKSTNANDGISTARQVLIDTVKGLSFSGGTPLSESYYETALYMLGEKAWYGRANSPAADSDYSLYADSTRAMNASNVYQSPVGEASCQSNNIVVLTDGLPTNDSDGEHFGDACGNSFACMQSTAKYLAKTNGRNGAFINTYTIGFGPVSSDATASAGLANTATAGGGEYFAATNGDSLAASFQAIFARVSDSNGTMAAPGVAVSQLNRSQHLDQLYYGVFKPKAQKRWPGNLKRYKLGSDNSVLGQNGDAIDPATKYFSVNARSFWSSVVDGNEATDGGAASKQTTALKVYTDLGAAGALPLLDSANPPAAMGTGTVGTDNVKWIQGYDVDNENGQGPSGFRQAMGSPIHPQPVMVSYGGSDESFAVLVSTNDGLLHSINNADGSHNWAFLPSALQGNVAALRENAGMAIGDVPIYGLDGSWTAATLTDGTRLLIGGMRQGGTNYYAIRLPATAAGAPVLQWMLTGASLEDAKTWSQPVLTRMRVSGAVTDVILVGGGLDDSIYEGGPSTVSGGADKGAAVYIINAKSGSIIRKVKVTAMKYSVPGSIRAVDKDGDTMADHLYFGDTGGQLFRVDIDNSKTASNLVKGVSLLAQLGISESAGKANDRRFYETPAVSYVRDDAGKIYAAVAIGSGDRNFPKSNKDTTDRFFVIKDYEAAKFGVATTSPTYKTSSLSNLTASSAVDNSKNGWFIDLPRSGEKVLSSPIIFSRVVTDGSGNASLSYAAYFNSYNPGSSAASTCSPVAGNTSTWALGLFDGTGQLSGGTRYADGVINGISGSTVALIRPTCPGPNCKDADGDGKDDADKKDVKLCTGTACINGGVLPGGLNIFQRVRWYDNPNGK